MEARKLKSEKRAQEEKELLKDLFLGKNRPDVCDDEELDDETRGWTFYVLSTKFSKKWRSFLE